MLDEVLALLRTRQRFLITTHVRPDGDAVGSQIALGRFLRALGKEVALLNSDAAPDNLGWLTGIDDVAVFDGSVAQHEQIAAAEVVIVVDTNAQDRLGKLGKPVRHSRARTVLIDHHPDPESWFDVTCVRDTASSTAELVYELITAHDPALLDPVTAEALYVAILTDTGSFRYSSVTPAVHRIVADLLERGDLEPHAIYGALYETLAPYALRLLVLVLETLTVTCDGRLAYLVVSQRMLNETGATHEDTEGFVNYALALEGVRVALIFSETPSGTKISFRSKGDWFVNEWARSLGGGGHRNASGAYVKKPLDVVIERVVAQAPRYLGLTDGGPDQDGTLSSEDQAYLSTLMDLKGK